MQIEANLKETRLTLPGRWSPVTVPGGPGGTAESSPGIHAWEAEVNIPQSRRDG
jgi:hypothetical protein